MKTKRLTRKEKNRMNQNNFIHVILAVAIVAFVITVYLWYQGNNQAATTDHIKYIKSFMSSSGTLRDYSNKLGMHDPKTDLKWFEKGDTIEIHFGRIILTWPREVFLLESTREELHTITMDYTVDKVTGNITVYYKGEVVSKWVE